MAIEIQCILVPIDFSVYATQALEYASTLAKQMNAEIELVHVVESSPYEVYQKSGFVHSVPIYARAGLVSSRSDSQYIVHDVLEETRNQMMAMVSEKVEYRVEARHGHVVEELLAEIEEFKPDLVVMCTHGWTGLKHLVLGSVVEKLVRLSPAPMLTFRAWAE